MKNEKKSAWIMSNAEYAAAGVLHQAIGYLKAKKGQTLEADEILKYIEKALADEKAQLEKQSEV